MAETNSITFRELDFLGFPGYRVGDDGSVWSCWRRTGRGGGYLSKITSEWKRMADSVNSKGYLTVNLTPPSKVGYKTFRVHRLVLLAFVGPCPDGMECRHLNSIRNDCRLDNIAWGTRKENHDDVRERGSWTNGPRMKRFTHDGKTMCLKEWARHLSVPYSCLWYRVFKSGMTFVEAISRPFLGVGSNGGHWNKLKRQSRLVESQGRQE